MPVHNICVLLSAINYNFHQYILASSQYSEPSFTHSFGGFSLLIRESIPGISVSLASNNQFSGSLYSVVYHNLSCGRIWKKPHTQYTHANTHIPVFLQDELNSYSEHPSSDRDFLPGNLKSMPHRKSSQNVFSALLRLYLPKSLFPPNILNMMMHPLQSYHS